MRQSRTATRCTWGCTCSGREGRGEGKRQGGGGGRRGTMYGSITRIRSTQGLRYTRLLWCPSDPIPSLGGTTRTHRPRCIGRQSCRAWGDINSSSCRRCGRKISGRRDGSRDNTSHGGQSLSRCCSSRSRSRSRRWHSRSQQYRGCRCRHWVARRGPLRIPLSNVRF